jgi:mannose-6-phosphate isomerase-like protein (cupin superfamily)
MIPLQLVKEFEEKYKGYPIIRIPEENPREIIAVMFVAPDKSFSTAVALIDESDPHYHTRTHEFYIVRRGVLDLFKRDLRGEQVNTHRMNCCTHEIPLNVIHWAKCVGPEPAEVLVYTWPAWTPEDHILDKGAL